MKKQIISEEFKRMQKLAGLINNAPDDLEEKIKDYLTDNLKEKKVDIITYYSMNGDDKIKIDSDTNKCLIKRDFVMDLVEEFKPDISDEIKWAIKKWLEEKGHHIISTISYFKIVDAFP